jgi:poly(A) polymerase/tRNA nucleotidyltransferase (CCA-adding enzyme)
MKLPDWQKALVKYGELYRVGGSVRDEIMGVASASKDIDYLVRGITPKQLEEVLSRYGQLAFVGKSFGVYKFKPSDDELEYDIAFPREEVSTGSGHREFDVDWRETVSVETDLERRDFTINAIAQNVEDGRILDPFDGRKDIESRRLRMIFAKAFREDPLRILRGIRFAARFELDVEGETADAMKASVPMLEGLSAERIQDEFKNIFVQCDRPSDAFAMMRMMGVLSVVFPELERAVGVEQNEYHPDDVFWHSVKTCDSAPKGNVLLRWAALLHDIGKVDAKQTVMDDDSDPRVVFYGHEKGSAAIAQTVLVRLRYSNDFVKRCVHLVRHHMYHYQPEWNQATVRRFIRTVGEENLDDMFELKRADQRSRPGLDRFGEIEELEARVREELEARHALKIADLEIDGSDVMKTLGIEGGERVGVILGEIFERVLDDPSLNRRDELLDLLSQYKDRGTGA